MPPAAPTPSHMVGAPSLPLAGDRACAACAQGTAALMAETHTFHVPNRNGTQGRVLARSPREAPQSSLMV